MGVWLGLPSHVCVFLYERWQEWQTKQPKACQAATVRSSVTHLCTERLCARALLRSAQTFDNVGQVTACFLGTSSTIDDVDEFEGTYRQLCTRRRREERLRNCAPGAVAPVKVVTKE